MALVGGGGAGNVAGSNPAGVGTSLNYIGDHAYGYSGVIGATSSGTTYLDFTTGREYIVGTVQCNYTLNQAEDMTYEIKMDGQVVQKWINAGATGVSNAGFEPQNPQQIIIPPYTRVEIVITSASTTRDQVASLVGRVYA